MDKNTIELRNERFLNIFLECIKLGDKLLFNENVKVDLEYPINPKVPSEAIDILIHDNKKALIIENKINNASDQKDQLPRYMEFVQEKLKISDYYVVYLTLVPGRKPPIENYSANFEKYKNLLLSGGKLILLSAVENNKENNSLVNFFLPRCEKEIGSILKNSESEDLVLTKVYINQYKILLNKLGGYTAMESTNRELAEQIFSDGTLINSSFDFVEFWKNRYDYLYPIIYEEMEGKVLECRESQYFYHEIKDNNCLVYFECKNHFSIGFTAAAEPVWSNKEFQRFNEIIKKYAEDNCKYFTCINEIENKHEGKNKKWTWTHYLLKENLSIAELKTIITKSFDELPNLVTQNGS